VSNLSEILAYNQLFVEKKEHEQFRTTKFPDKKMVILSCMDTRLSELLPNAMNLHNGDAKFIKNAGAVVSHPFGSIMRSIMVAVYELHAEEVFVIGHYDCGMTSIHAPEVLEHAVKRGISRESITTLSNAGIDLNNWLKGFSDVQESVANSVKQIKSHPLFAKDIPVHGLIIDPDTGKLDLVVDGYAQ
jgi:carbonic anhydrase